MTTALLLLCSCGDDDKTEALLPQDEERHLISVSATTQDFTRTGEATMDDLKSNGFSVIAVEEKQDGYGETYKDVYENFPDQCDYNVQTSAWEFQSTPLHFWPEKEDGEDEDGNPIKITPKLDFYALYSPKGTAFFSWDHDTHVGDYIDILPSSLDQAEDIMLATLTEYSYDSNPQAPGVLKFDFKHLLTNVSINAKVTSKYPESYDYYTISVNLNVWYYERYYIARNYWHTSEAGRTTPVQFGFENDVVQPKFALNDTDAKQVGTNHFVVPNEKNELYTIFVECNGHMNNEDEGSSGAQLQYISAPVDLSGCAGKNVVLNLTIDLHNDEIAIDTKHFHTSLDAPATRPSCE